MNTSEDMDHPDQNKLDIKDLVNSVSSYKQCTTWGRDSFSILFWDYNVSFHFDKEGVTITTFLPRLIMTSVKQAHIKE